MEPFSVKSFFNYLDSVRARTNRLIQVIPPASLDFAYMPGKFTIGDQIRHIATIERYLFAEVIAGRKSAYNGCGKELADGYTDVLNFFNELHRESLQIFNSLHDEDMNRKCMTPGNVEILASFHDGTRNSSPGAVVSLFEYAADKDTSHVWINFRGIAGEDN